MFSCFGPKHIHQYLEPRGYGCREKTITPTKICRSSYGTLLDMRLFGNWHKLDITQMTVKLPIFSLVPKLMTICKGSEFNIVAWLRFRII